MTDRILVSETYIENNRPKSTTAIYHTRVCEGLAGTEYHAVNPQWKYSSHYNEVRECECCQDDTNLGEQYGSETRSGLAKELLDDD